MRINTDRPPSSRSPSYLSLPLSPSDSFFPSLGSLRRNNSSFGSSSSDPWLTAVGLLWETGRLQGEVGKDLGVAEIPGGRKRWGEIWRKIQPGFSFFSTLVEWLTAERAKLSIPPVEGGKIV